MLINNNRTMNNILAFNISNPNENAQRKMCKTSWFIQIQLQRRLRKNRSNRKNNGLRNCLNFIIKEFHSLIFGIFEILFNLF